MKIVSNPLVAIISCREKLRQNIFSLSLKLQRTRDHKYMKKIINFWSFSTRMEA